MMECATEAVNVACCRGLAADLFWRHVGLFADHRAGGVAANFIGGTKIDQHDRAIWTQHQVIGADVAVDNDWFLAVQEMQNVSQLRGPSRDGAHCRQSELAHVLAQIGAGNVFQLQVAAPVFRKVIEHAADAGMRKLLQELGFTSKLFACLLLDGRLQTSRQNRLLEDGCSFFGSGAMFHQVHCRPAAKAQLSDYFHVAPAYLLAWFQRHERRAGVAATELFFPQLRVADSLGTFVGILQLALVFNQLRRALTFFAP